MSFPDGVPGHISQICEDSRLEALLTDDVGNLSVCFQRVRVTGEDISGVNCLSDLVVSYRTCRRKVASGLTLTCSGAGNLEQDANLVCAQDNSSPLLSHHHHHHRHVIVVIIISHQSTVVNRQSSISHQSSSSVIIKQATICSKFDLRCRNRARCLICKDELLYKW